jgi:hypothetical protein
MKRSSERLRNLRFSLDVLCVDSDYADAFGRNVREWSAGGSSNRDVHVRCCVLDPFTGSSLFTHTTEPFSVQIVL